MNIQEAKDWLNSQDWIFAKSYATTFPHRYTTRKKCKSPELFECVLHFIRDKAKLKTFHRKQYLYCEIDGFEYWEMGRPIPAVQVLNRAPINDEASYRFPEPPVNAEAIIKAKLQEREDRFKALLSHPNPGEKERRMIAFLMNSERRIHGGGKNIMDHYTQEVRYE